MQSRRVNLDIQSGNCTVTEADISGLKKAHKYEKKLEGNGWRWHKINARCSVFIPCEQDGTPTEKGKKIIRLFEEHLKL